MSSEMSPSLWRDSVHLIGPAAGKLTSRLLDPEPLSALPAIGAAFTFAAVTVVGYVPGMPPIAWFVGSEIGGAAAVAQAAVSERIAPITRRSVFRRIMMR